MDEKNRIRCINLDLKAIAKGICKQGIALKTVSIKTASNNRFLETLPCYGDSNTYSRCRFFTARSPITRINYSHQYKQKIDDRLSRPLALFNEQCPVCGRRLMASVYVHAGQIESKVICETLGCLEFRYPRSRED